MRLSHYYSDKGERKLQKPAAVAVAVAKAWAFSGDYTRGESELSHGQTMPTVIAERLLSDLRELRTFGGSITHPLGVVRPSYSCVISPCPVCAGA